MAQVALGFAVILGIIAIGYVVGRLGMLGPQAQDVLARLAFFVLSPCLMFTVLSQADVHTLFSKALAASAIAALGSALIYILVVRLAWHRPTPELTVGALAASYCNAGNVGIAISMYILGDAAYAAPIMLLQMLVMAPAALTALDLSTSSGLSARSIAAQPFKNPLLIAALLGVLVALTGARVPTAVAAPLSTIGQAAVPIMLLAFGLSLHGQRILEPGSGRRDVIFASAIKMAIMPAIAWLAGSALGLDHDMLRAVVVLAALPVAQNVFNYAQRYNRGVIIARDAISITTLGSIPVLVLVSTFLA